MLGIVLAAGLFACGQSKFTTADQCLLVDLKAEQVNELAVDLDAFAQANGLVADTTLPIAPLYLLRADGKKIAIVTYSVGVLESVSEVALFRFDSRGSEKLARAFEQFVNREVQPRYGVNRCAEVPGYSLPKASE